MPVGYNILLFYLLCIIEQAPVHIFVGKFGIIALLYASWGVRR
jgi:hypothetical protein